MSRTHYPEPLGLSDVGESYCCIFGYCDSSFDLRCVIMCVGKKGSKVNELVNEGPMSSI